MIAQEDLDRLAARRETLLTIRASGTRSTQTSAGLRVEYRSDAELAAAIADIDAQLAAVRGTVAPRVSTIRFVTSKGL